MRIGRAPSTGRAMLAPTGAGLKTALSFDNGNIPITSVGDNRATAKPIRSVFTADRFPAAAGRTSDARPYDDGVFLITLP